MRGGDANHAVGKFLCSRYACGVRSEIDTPAGAMCRMHSSPLMFSIRRPYELRNQPDGVPFEVPWAFVAPHDAQARRNHGGQTLARLSERGGLCVSELVAVLEGRDWRDMPRPEAAARLRELLVSWAETPAPRANGGSK